MNIAILGASSQIARDLTKLLVADKQKQLYLFGRQAPFLDYQEFARHTYDVVINFVGAGNPQKTADMGSAILDITAQYDQLALTYLSSHPACKYIFLSSGAAYGGDFSQPVTEASHAVVPLNNVQPQDWYAMAKLYAEYRHRALTQYAIYDIRVFNYFSQSQHLSDRFLISEIVDAILTGRTFRTSAASITRDFITPLDFYQLIACILQSPPMNIAIDCYSQAPIEKHALLGEMRLLFGLKHEVLEPDAPSHASRIKTHYYSLNRVAATLGYAPAKTSLAGIVDETRLILDRHRNKP